MIHPIESLIIDIQRAVEKAETCLDVVADYLTNPYKLQYLQDAQAELAKIMVASIAISKEVKSVSEAV